MTPVRDALIGEATDDAGRIMRESDALHNAGRSVETVALSGRIRDEFDTSERWGGKYALFCTGDGAALPESGDPRTARFFLHEAERIHSEFHQRRELANTWFNLGTVANYLQDTDQAVREYTASLSLYKTIGDAAGELKVTLALAALILDDVQRQQLESIDQRIAIRGIGPTRQGCDSRPRN